MSAHHEECHAAVMPHASYVGPITLLLLPKCPLCLLPLVAALGIGVPAGPLLNAIVAAIVLAWVFFFVRATPSRALRAAIIAIAAVVIAGRVTSLRPLEISGVTMMVGFALLRNTRSSA